MCSPLKPAPLLEENSILFVLAYWVSFSLAPWSSMRELSASASSLVRAFRQLPTSSSLLKLCRPYQRINSRRSFRSTSLFRCEILLQTTSSMIWQYSKQLMACRASGIKSFLVHSGRGGSQYRRFGSSYTWAIVSVGQRHGLSYERSKMAACPLYKCRPVACSHALPKKGAPASVHSLDKPVEGNEDGPLSHSKLMTKLTNHQTMSRQSCHTHKKSSKNIPNCH